MPSRWDNFFVMVGGGAAALAGFDLRRDVDQPDIIIRNQTHKNPACGFALIGNQRVAALGAEWLVLWVIATAIFIRGYVIAMRSGMSSIGLNAPRLASDTICHLAEVVGAILLILGYRSGLYIMAGVIVTLFAFLISGAWLLIIGIYEDQAGR